MDPAAGVATVDEMPARRTWLLLVAAVFLALCPAAASAPQLPAGLQRLEGHWVYAGGDDERQARLDAIDATVRQMSFFVRFIARRMIREATAIPPGYTITVHDHQVRVRKDDDRGIASGWDGQPVRVSENGDAATLTRVWEDGALRSHLQRPRGSGTEIMRPEAGGARMSVKVVVSSSHLPSDIAFTLTYRKTSGADAPQ